MFLLYETAIIRPCFSYVTEENYVAVAIRLKVKEPKADISPYMNYS